MLTLLQKLTGKCFTVAIVSFLIAGSASATGSPSAYSEDAKLMHAIAEPMDMPRPTPLLYAGADPVKVAGGPEQIYKTRTRGVFSSRDLDCLAEALYFEARGEGRQGQAAVAEVILNRVASGRFPGSVCGVVNQPSQFSYTIGGPKTIRNKSAYLRVRQVAEHALVSGTGNLTGGATYFHTPAVRPAWSHRFQRTVRIGHHIFYRTDRRVASN